MRFILRNFISHAGVETIGVFHCCADGCFDPAAVAAVAGVVGEPNTMNGSNNIIINPAVHFVGSEEWTDAAGVFVQCPIMGDSEFEGMPCFGMYFDQVLKNLGNALIFGQHAVGHTVSASRQIHRTFFRESRNK